MAPRSSLMSALRDRANVPPKVSRAKPSLVSAFESAVISPCSVTLASRLNSPNRRTESGRKSDALRCRARLLSGDWAD